MAEPGVKKRRFRTAILIMALSLAVIISGLGGAGLWLRSASGERFLFDKIAAIMAESGFELSAAEIAGPLPGRLFLREVKFSDKDGPIATFDEAELRLNVRGLFDKTLHMERLALKNPELFRLPALEQSADEEPPAPFTLPVAVQLDELAIDGAVLHGGILPGGPENPPLAFTVNGAGRLDKGGASQLPLELALSLEITDLAALNPSVSGPLKADIKGGGTLADLNISADLASSSLNTPSALLENAALKLNLAGQLMNAQAAMEPVLDGTLLIQALSPAGPLNFAAEWHCRSEGGVLAELKNLEASLGALNFAGGISADLRGEKPALNGSLTAETADWIHLASLIGQPLSGGPAKLSVELVSENSRQSVAADLDLPKLRLAGAKGENDIFSINRAKAAIRAADLFGQADLEADISLGPGLASAAQWSGAQLKAGGRAGDGVFSTDIQGLALQGFGGTAHDGLELAGAYDLNEKSLLINQLELAMAASGLKLNSPARVGFGDYITLSPVSLAILPSGSLAAEMDLRPNSLNLKADLAALPFSFIKPFAGPETFVPEGMLEALTVHLNQGPNGLSGTADLAASVKYQGLAPSLALHGELSGGGARPALALSGRIGGGPGWDAAGDLKATLPLKPGPGGSFPQPDMGAALSASLDFSGPVEPLWQLAGQPDRLLRGVVAIKAQAGGALAKPEPRGALYLAGGRYEDRLLGLLVQDINLEAHSTPAELLRATAEAKDSRGGGLALAAVLNKAAGGLEMDVTGRLGRFNPLQRDDISLYLSGDIAAKGSVARPMVTSDLTVDRGELDLKVLMASKSIPTLTIAEGNESVSATRGPRLDMNIKVPNQFFIRGYGLDSEWRGDLKVGGFSARPSLAGRLAPVRGYFELFSREFQFTGGDISFNGGADPNLNLELTNHGPSIAAVINIGGRGTAPSLTMSSRPPQPQEEVLAQVLFGKNASSLSHFEALQLAAGLRELTSFGEEGSFSFDPISSVRQELGLDVLRLGGADGESGRAISDASGSLAQDMQASGTAAEAPAGGTTLEAGKYINDKVYVGVEHAASGGPAFRVEMELSPLMSLEARSSTESSQIGVGWKKDY